MNITLTKVLLDWKKPTRLCNCRYKDNCPLVDKCLIKWTVYKGNITTTDKHKVGYGTSDGVFKAGCNNHARHKTNLTDTELSKYIWKLSSDKIQYEIKWNIAAYASFYKCDSSAGWFMSLRKVENAEWRSWVTAE